MAEITDVLTKLVERTGQNKVGWKPTADEKTFMALIGDNSVTISSPKGLYVPDVVLRVLDKDGREIDRLDSTAKGGELTPELRQLFEKARSVALSVPKELDELLKELERI